MALLPLCAALPAEAQGAKPSAASGGAPTYARDIRPLFKARCVVCHNQGTVENVSVSGGLALDTYAALKKGVVQKSGARAIFAAGHSADSELFRRLSATSPAKLMPRGGPALPPAQIALVKKWIDAGAPAGDVSADKPADKPAPGALPMPANPASQDVTFPTRLTPTPDLIKKDTPKNAALAFALKVGPLPPVTALAYSPDGKLLAVGGYRAVTLWDTATGKPVACLSRLAGPVQSLAFRPDGSVLAVAGGVPGAVGEARLYDAKTFALLGTGLVGHTDVIYSIAWSPDGAHLATASQDKTARLWDWPSGKESKVLRDNADAVTRICFAPDGKSVYTASQDHNLRRFDVSNGSVLRVFSGHNEGVTALAVNANGSRVLSAGSEPRLRWWNPDDGNTVTYSDGHSATITEVVFGKNGQMIASVSADHTVRLWDANGGAQRTLEGSTDWVYSVAISPDGKFVAGAGAEGVVRVWEAANGRLRLTLLSWPPSGKATVPDWLALTPEGFFEASPAWTKLLHPLLAGKPLAAPRLTAFFLTLRQAESVLKGWQGAALEPAKLPEPAAPPPAKPATAAPAKPGK